MTPQLQQLDRLLQLGRHHQALRLAQVEALTHCHGGSLSPEDGHGSKYRAK
jgi:hypothetical protein